MVGVFIIILIILFGGTLAFLGDRVGMKVGKKRLTIFGLRPKYTSIIITVLTGFFIAGLTLFVLTMLSEYVRTAIFELGTIQKDLELATNKVTILTKEITVKEEEYSSLSSEHGRLKKENKAVEEQLGKIHVEYQQVSEELQIKQGELQVQQERVNNLAQINESLTKDIITKEAALGRYEQQIANLEGDLLQLSDVNDHNQSLLSEPLLFWVGEILASQVVKTADQTAEEVFAKVIQPLLLEANKLAVQRGAKIEGKSAYALLVDGKKVDEITDQLAKADIEGVIRVIVEKNSVADEPVTATIELYPNEVIFKSGGVVSETRVNGGNDESKLRDEILSLLILANHKAIERGINGQDLQNMISVSDMVQVIRAIKNKPDSSFKVKLVADGDIYRINQFKVKLKLEELNE